MRLSFSTIIPALSIDNTYRLHIYAVHEHCFLLKSQTDMCVRSVSLHLLLLLLLAPLDATTAHEETVEGQEEEDADDLIAIQVFFG